MKDETQALLRLQEIDLELLRIENKAKSMPQAQKLSEIDKALKQLAPQISKCTGKRKDLEMDYEDRLTAKNKLIEKQAEVQSSASSAEAGFRSIKDFETQLSALAKGIEKAAFDEARLESEIERAEAEEKKYTDMRSRLQTEKQKLLDSLNAEAKEMRENAQALIKERERVAVQVSPELQKRYIDSRQRFGIVAVETLTGNMPSGCHVKLQPAEYSKLRKQREEICDCPYCGRILVLGDMSSASSAASTK